MRALPEAIREAAAGGRDDHPARWRILGLLATAELLGMSVWLAASAVSPQLRALWDLGATEAGWLTSSVQLGFVAGTVTAAVLNLADLVPSRRYFAASALLAAVANAGLLAGGFGAAVVTRFLTGFCLAGVYPPAMKMAATWFRSARGLAIGTVVGALTVGKATPYLVDAVGGVRFQTVIAVTSAAALLAALLIAIGYRDGPYAFERRPFSWALAGEVLRVRRWRLVTAGYLGHMWELYAFWGWIATFLAASAAARDGTGGRADPAIEMVAFLVIGIGGLGCLWGGWQADRIGRERLVVRAMAASGACALFIGLAYGQSLVLVTMVAAIWGFFVIADSAQFSALVTEVVPPHAVGTALTLQTSLGFLLTIVTLQLVPFLAEDTGWRWAFVMLAVGPAFGIQAIRRLSGGATLERAPGKPTR